MLGRSFAPPTPEMAEHEKAAEAFAKNRERLKAERLAREAGEPPKRKTAGPD